MSYDRWKFAFVTEIICSLGVGLCVILSWGTWYATLWSVVLIFFLLVTLVLAVTRPDMIWAVSTTGFNVENPDEQVKKVHGPFHSKKSAKDFAEKWDHQFKGFAVIEGRVKEKEKNK